MKKIIVALVAMFVMTMSANAQSEKDQQLAFYRMSSYLELRIDQMEPVKTAMAQFTNSLEALYQLNDASKGTETWQRIEDRHKQKMQNILTKKQYNKYVQMLELTEKNHAERITQQMTASK